MAKYVIDVDMPTDREWHYNCESVEQLRTGLDSFEKLGIEVVGVREGERDLTVQELAKILSA